jgi:hypothetical protein
MCVLATCGPDGPLATPVRYYHLDFTLLVTASPVSPKMRNIAADPRVSVGIFAPLVGQASSRGAQIFGTARTLTVADAEFAHYWPAGLSVAVRPCRTITVAGGAARRTAHRHPGQPHRVNRALAAPGWLRAVPVLVRPRAIKRSPRPRHAFERQHG